MARRILITFIGTGPIAKNDKSIREYKPAIYKFDGKEFKTTFIAAALKDFLEIDTIYLFGTMKSMWEEVYHYFSEKKDNFDENYYYDLGEKCGEKADSTTPLEPEFLNKLSETIGNESKTIPIHYGLNEEEIRANFEIFVNAFEDLQDGDELYLDITHSFRSLPLFATTAINLLQDVSGKNILLKGIYYGMLEVSRELSYTPIVNLSYIRNLQSWIKGAYTFETTGNAKLLTELLENKNQTSAQKLNEFSRVLSLNFVHDIKSQIAVLKSLGNENNYDLPEKLILPAAFKNFLNFFNKAKTLSDYQFLLAKWHYDKSAYGLSYLCLIESIISYRLEQNGKSETEVKNEKNREDIKGELLSDSELKSIYGPANQYRKTIAHVTEERQDVFQDGKKHSINCNNALSNLKKYLNKFEKIKIKNAH